MVLPPAVRRDPIGVLGVTEVLKGGGGDPPVQCLEPLLDSGVLQDLHLPRKQPLQLDLSGSNAIAQQCSRVDQQKKNVPKKYLSK